LFSSYRPFSIDNKSTNPKTELKRLKKTDTEEVKISNDTKFKADKVKSTYNLTVKDISFKDSCTFRCVARNKLPRSEVRVAVARKWF
jgi:hypothetical protein